MKWLFPILIATSAAAIEPLPQQQQPQKLNGVSQAAIQSAFQILRSEYIRGDDLTYDELSRAALQGLLQRLDLGAELVAKDTSVKQKLLNGVLTESLAPQIGYLRPIAWAENEVEALETALAEYRAAKVAHLILDLRSPAPPGEFTIAAGMLDLFIPRGEVMFRLQKVGSEEAQLFISNRDPVWTNPILVLVDGETNNLGETVAAVLKHTKRAIIIGSKTRGATVRYETVPLDDHWQLRFARAEVLIQGVDSLFRKGLEPDFHVALSSTDKRRTFDIPESVQSVKETVFETAVPRYNEAALVARKNPELDSYIRRSSGKKTDSTTSPAKDTVLQRAVDLITARLHFQASTTRWNQKNSASASDRTAKDRKASNTAQ